MYNKIWASINDDDPDYRKYAVVCARKTGKSFLLCLIALEYALRFPNSQIWFAAPTADALRNITRPLFNQLLEDCPDKLRPVYRHTEKLWRFHNGSEIHIEGTDSDKDAMRGPSSNLNLVDEAGFCSNLGYIIKSVLVPMTQRTMGKTIMASTPSASPNHDFKELVDECSSEGYYSEYDIYSVGLTERAIQREMKEAGGADSTTWKREYLCQWITDSDTAIIPEWKSSMVLTPEQLEQVRDIRPEYPLGEYYPYWHKYVAIDFGTVDNTAILFAHWNFREAKLVVEDEVIVKGSSVTSKFLADTIKDKERQLGWLAPTNGYQLHGRTWNKDQSLVYKRVGDNDKGMLQSLSIDHGLYVIGTDKDLLEKMVNDVRLLVNAGQLAISPKCPNLIAAISTGVWKVTKENKRAFARSKQSVGNSTLGHLDSLAALVYLVRNLDRTTNPVPPLHGINNPDRWVIADSRRNQSQVAADWYRGFAPQK